MGGHFARNKGQRGEREVIAYLQPVVTRTYEAAGLKAPVLQRNSLQAHLGGSDIHGLGWLALEVKYHETEKINQWWEQTVKQAEETQEPVLMWRSANKKWKVMIYVTMLGELVRAQIDLESFLSYFEKRVRMEMAIDGPKLGPKPQVIERSAVVEEVSFVVQQPPKRAPLELGLARPLRIYDRSW